MLNLNQVKVPRSEVAGLTEMLSNWNRLHKFLLDQGASVVLREKLLALECSGRKRLAIVTRLLGVYHRLVRTANIRHVGLALGVK